MPYDPMEERLEGYLNELDTEWELDCQEWERTEQETDYLRHNLQWMNALHWIKWPHLYLKTT